jgi:hypothetical protein
MNVAKQVLLVIVLNDWVLVFLSMRESGGGTSLWGVHNIMLKYSIVFNIIFIAYF